MIEMEAGPALDAEIARRLCDLVPCDTWQYVNFGSAGGPTLVKACEHEHCYSTLTVASMFGYVGGAPRYSTEIAAAWAIVEHMNREGWQVQLSGDGEPWACSFWQSWRNGTVNQHGDGEADTAPLAICRAALATVAAKVPA